MKTYSPKPEHIERRWFVIDAAGVVLGRVASEAAHLLRGKHKPIYAPHMDTGDNVIIVNAEKVALTGGKETKKIAYRHSGYPGGIKGDTYERILREKPGQALERAIRGMLPKNRLGRAMFGKLHVVVGPDHSHAAQKPVEHKIGDRPAWEGIPAPKTRVEKTAPEPKKPARKRATAKPSTAKPTTRKASTATKKKSTATSRKKATTTKAKSTATKKPTTRKATTTRAKKKEE